jgi:hypothetical protein
MVVTRCIPIMNYIFLIYRFFCDKSSLWLRIINYLTMLVKSDRPEVNFKNKPRCCAEGVKIKNYKNPLLRFISYKLGWISGNSTYYFLAKTAQQRFFRMLRYYDTQYNTQFPIPNTQCLKKYLINCYQEANKTIILSRNIRNIS